MAFISHLKDSLLYWKTTTVRNEVDGNYLPNTSRDACDPLFATSLTGQAHLIEGIDRQDRKVTRRAEMICRDHKVIGQDHKVIHRDHKMIGGDKSSHRSR